MGEKQARRYNSKNDGIKILMAVVAALLLSIVLAASAGPQKDSSSISGYKINDTNHNGKWDIGETGILGWHIRLIGIASTGLDIKAIGKETSTDSLGFYKFDNLPASPVGAPSIISFAPPSPVSDIVGATIAFNLTANQTVNVSWYINGTEVLNQTGENESTYTNTSAALGIWNITAIAANVNGTAVQTWIWNVTSQVPTAGSLAIGLSPVVLKGSTVTIDAGDDQWKFPHRNDGTGSLTIRDNYLGQTGLYFWNALGEGYNGAILSMKAHYLPASKRCDYYGQDGACIYLEDGFSQDGSKIIATANKIKLNGDITLNDTDNNVYIPGMLIRNTNIGKITDSAGTLKAITPSRQWGTMATNPADGDRYYLYFYADGTETQLNLGTAGGNDLGIWDLYVNGELDSSGYDDYNVKGDNIRQIILNRDIIQGQNTIELRVNGKNKKSSAYAIEVLGAVLQ